VSKKRRRFKIQIDTSDLVIEFFCNFVIKPPGKIVIGSLDFSAFFRFGPWFRIVSNKSLIGYQTSIIMQLSP